MKMHNIKSGYIKCFCPLHQIVVRNYGFSHEIKLIEKIQSLQLKTILLERIHQIQNIDKLRKTIRNKIDREPRFLGNAIGFALSN
jgi:hypothetical protein